MSSFRRWWLLFGAVLVGVVALNGVVDAKAVAARGAVCVRVGAKALDGVSGRGLVCVQTKVRGLRWRFAPTAVTTPTIATSTSATTTVASANVAPRVVSASAVSGNAVITIADMSPDTGVYAVQWVSAGQSFNSYQMYRTTTKTMTVPYLSCTRTYTLRVFVMQANWQMTDGFVNQNVTPHSATFDLTMPACTAAAAAAATTAAATTTTVALNCATGAACVVGDTGPGGGIVFYVHASGTFACGATLASTCKYLEAAPTTGANSWTDARYVWSGNTSTLIGSTAQGQAIGTGYKNTEAIVTQSDGGTTVNKAGTIARAYRGPNSLSDWYLPSTLELNQLCRYAWNLTVDNSATTCTGVTGTIRSGFSSVYYWSSSESAASHARLQGFDSGSQYSDRKTSTYFVRPVRAFG